MIQSSRWVFCCRFLPCHPVRWKKHNAILKPRPTWVCLWLSGNFFPRLCESGPCSLILKIVRASFWLYANHILMPGCCPHLNLITPAIWLILLTFSIFWTVVLGISGPSGAKADFLTTLWGSSSLVWGWPYSSQNVLTLLWDLPFCHLPTAENSHNSTRVHLT